MVEVEEKLEAALRARKSLDRDQRRRLVWAGMSGASYAVDTLFLALFALAGSPRWFETAYALDAWVAWLLPLALAWLWLKRTGGLARIPR